MPDSKTFMASLFDWPEVLITRARIFLLSIKLLVKVPAWFIETTSEKYKAELLNRFSRAGFKSARTVVIAIPVVAQFIGRFLPDPPKAETLLNS